ncbi:hypothetical protein U5B43_10420 [Campylobacter sp. 9BO]|uniref:hypothetical protein n=1 Tax=Campylobacter sp. 9BO TaxID=3424759 RepID=UPI003D33627B
MSKERLALYHARQSIRKMVFIVLLFLALILIGGCAKKQESISFKEIYVPVKCEVELPSKPKFNPNEPQTARDLAQYFMQVEELLKGCVGGK